MAISGNPVPGRFFAAVIIAIFIVMTLAVWAGADFQQTRHHLQQACTVLHHHSLTSEGC